MDAHPQPVFLTREKRRSRATVAARSEVFGHARQDTAFAAPPRRAEATSAATAHDARRVVTESARLVSMTGTRAPSTTPAASAPARNDRLFASILPASRSGTTRTLARPATGEAIFLIRA